MKPKPTIPGGTNTIWHHFTTTEVSHGWYTGT